MKGLIVVSCGRAILCWLSIALVVGIAGCAKSAHPSTTSEGGATDSASVPRSGDQPGDDAGDPRAFAGAAWPMPNPAVPGLPQPARYSVVSEGGSDEVVRDEVTGLSWQRAVGARGVTYREARSYCAQLAYAGSSDWRLPSRIELVSLIDFTRSMELSVPTPAIDMSAFPATGGDWFWSSSPKAGDDASAWYVYFYFGYVDVDTINGTYNARCVRSFEPAKPSDLDVLPATVRDRSTGLTWQRTASSEHFSFTAAATYCANLELGGATDWRVPTMKELQTVVDESRDAPALASGTFPDASAEGYWTSTLWAASSNQAWFVEFTHGSCVYGLTTMAYRVRCVR